METYSTTTNTNGSEFSQAGAHANVNGSSDPMESDTPSPEDPLATTYVEEPSTGPGNSDSCVTNPVVRISGITEIGRDSKTSKLGSWKPAFEVQKGYEASFAEICERAESVLFPADAVPAPTASTPYGAADELFDRMQKAIAAQTCLSEPASRLLAHWTLSTWFADALPLAPGLAIVGPGYEGEQVLCALRNFCRYPLMLMRADINSLKNVNWHATPTLLFHDPSLTKQMASLLGCTATRGHLVGDGGYYRDFFGAKAVYLGEEVSADRIPLCSVQVNVHPIAAARAIDKASRLTEVEVQKLQNELLNYRLKNLVRVYNTEFDASTLTSDTRAIANSLGACVVDSPKLQSELITLLTPVQCQREADRSTGIEAVTVEAALNLCHAGRQELLAGEIAIEVNRIQKARGERLSYSAERVGHSLKKVGLYTRRLGKAGRGLVLDLATMVRLHELAAVYGGAGLDLDEKNLHCHLCAVK